MWVMAQVVELLSSKCKALNSIPTTSKKKGTRLKVRKQHRSKITTLSVLREEII
jgi:hypothetical protein